MALLRPPENGRIESVDPRTGEVLGTARVMTPDEVAKAIDEARRVQREWGALAPRDRAAHLRRVRGLVAERGEELARLVSAETGKPLTDAWFEVAAACSMLHYAASAAPRALRARRVPTAPLVLKRATLRYEPLGVVGAIAPWNYPLGIPMQVLPFALAAGDTVVLKPSELTSLTGLLLGEVVNAAGVDLVHVVTGDGATGEAVVRGDIDKLAFTGSGVTARRILTAAAERLLPVVVELGGKDPVIVCDDADVSQAARAAAGAAFSHAGQTCMAAERVLVTPAAYDRFVGEVVELARQMRPGGDPTSALGPLTRREQAEVVERRLADAVAGGARVLVGGRKWDAGGSWFFEPTVVVDADPACELAREESFAPVMTVFRVRDVDEAVEMANDTDYGLAASVFTADRALAESVVARLEAGGVNVNDVMVASGIPSLPFGGVKQSGFGRLQGDHGFWEMSRLKSVAEDRFGRSRSLAAAMFTGRRPSPGLLRRLVGVGYGAGVAARLRALVGVSRRR